MARFHPKINKSTNTQANFAFSITFHHMLSSRSRCNSSKLMNVIGVCECFGPLRFRQFSTSSFQIYLLFILSTESVFDTCHSSHKHIPSSFLSHVMLANFHRLFRFHPWDIPALFSGIKTILSIDTLIFGTPQNLCHTDIIYMNINI